ncbi:hypothetical protein Hte_005598 [Hypoxylon texense]
MQRLVEGEIGWEDRYKYFDEFVENCYAAYIQHANDMDIPMLPEKGKNITAVDLWVQTKVETL